ncbi:SDR family NAD(P)-dependent oxidoreductase [Yinghuangia seranimata]|uniref:SDR family NAD(P)-dependent oxidoreductase n=1 Tax=Yinghuangia seranimata TaxID=408067 RepID=UPI00248ADB89|nr:SDR family NAD(P)-dependent oxidoreductase [Yinghuangia seranimata]MDI2129400.1 SDR family NAD(P)-dependent oxidoreductase [Yinghuangia seranimata]
MFELTGRTALVTGAGQGVGGGIAEALAAQGAQVAVNDLDPQRAEDKAKALRDAGHNAHAVPFDVTDHGAVRDAVRAFERSVGPVDILVNNVGNAGSGEFRPRPFRESDPADWRRFTEVNLFGVMNCVKAVIDGMSARRYGRIITIASGSGVVGQAIGVSLYAAAKGGAIAFMRHLAMESAADGVTANTIALGLIDPAASGREGAQVREMAARLPVGRIGLPSDPAAMCAYLASNEASWITGQTLHLNGGSYTS